MPRLDSKKWAIAAQRIAEGRSQADTARELGVHPRTVRRWADGEDFQSQVTQLKARLHPVMEQQREDELSQWIDEARNHLREMKSFSQLARRAGRNAALKALHRLQDLPDEALRPCDAIALLKIGKDLVLESFEIEADALGIYDLVQNISEDERVNR